MAMNLNKVFVDFGDALKKRNTIFNEETIRYIFLLSMHKQDSNTDKYILEMPYKNEEKELSGCDFSAITKEKRNVFKKMDLFYSNENKSIAFEFKFDRKSDTDSGTTNKAGYIFNDIQRLQLIKGKTIKSIKKIFVYVTTEEMDSYFLIANRTKTENEELRKKLKKFYTRKKKKNFYFKHKFRKIRKMNRTFYKCCNDSFVIKRKVLCVKLKLLYKKCFSTNSKDDDMKKIHIRIYEVLN